MGQTQWLNEEERGAESRQEPKRAKGKETDELQWV